jgi:hypothetical protein
MPEKTRAGPKSTEPAQIDKFRDAARELKTDQSEKRFRAIVRKVGAAPPAPAQEKLRKKRE